MIQLLRVSLKYISPEFSIICDMFKYIWLINLTRYSLLIVVNMVKLNLCGAQTRTNMLSTINEKGDVFNALDDIVNGATKLT